MSAPRSAATIAQQVTAERARRADAATPPGGRYAADRSVGAVLARWCRDNAADIHFAIATFAILMLALTLLAAAASICAGVAR